MPATVIAGASMTPEGLAIGEPAEFGQRPLHEELRGERRDREIETTQAEAGQAEEKADRSRGEPGEDHAAKEGQAGDAAGRVGGRALCEGIASERRQTRRRSARCISNIPSRICSGRWPRGSIR